MNLFTFANRPPEAALAQEVGPNPTHESVKFFHPRYMG
jgi:hypothetical protein